MRCFVAAWPDAPTRLALAALSDELRQRVEHRRVTSSENLHLTLAFIAQTKNEVAAVVARAIDGVRFEPFTWQLDLLGFFREAGVVWAGSSAVEHSALNRLARDARAVLDRSGVEYDRRPLSPHITLLRGVRAFDAEVVHLPINWRVDSIALYRSAGRGGASRYVRVA